MKRFGYKKGILLGLLLYATGAFLFYPAIHIQEFWAFLAALFIIALGLTCLETAANPYTTVLGPPERSAQRLNLSQSFNGLGWVIGPIVGSLILFATRPVRTNSLHSGHPLYWNRDRGAACGFPVFYHKASGY